MRIFCLLFALLLWVEASSQCCTSGCCSPGTANFGVLEKGDLLAFSFFKHNYSDRYYHGDAPMAFSYLKNDFSDYAGVSLSYGITNKLTAQVSAGYFITKTENFDLPQVGQQQFLGSGLADLEIYLKGNVYHSKNDVFNITISGGSKMPTGQYKLAVNNVTLSRDVQPGTGAFSAVGIFYVLVKPFRNKNYSIMLNSRTDHNWANPQGFQYGISNTNTLSSTIKLTKEFSLLAMFRNENRDCDRINGTRMFSSASCRFFASPGIQLTTQHLLSFAVFGDIPVYQFYAGTQLAGKYAFSIALSKVFELHKKHVPEEEVKITAR